MASVKAMLDPDPASTWALPRAFAVDVCPVNYRRAINIDSGYGVILDATPDLYDTLKVSTRPAAAPTVNLRGFNTINTHLFSRNGMILYPELLFTDPSGNYVEVPYFMVDDPNGIVLLTDGKDQDVDDGGFQGFTPVFKKKLIYVATNALAAYDNTSFMMKFSSGTVTSVTQRFEVLDVNLTVLGFDSQTTNAPVSGTTYVNINGVGVSGPFFTFSLTLANGATPISIDVIEVNIGTNPLTLDYIQTISYGPSPDISGALYRSVVESSSKYSFPLMSMLVSFVGSDLLNGGNIAIGVVPDDYSLSLIPEIAYAQICALGGRYFSGAMKNGVHGIYIPDDLTRIAFLPIGEKIKGRRLCVAILPQHIPSGPSSNATMRIELRSHIEFINASQTLAHLTSNCYATECLESMFAALDAETQVGENPTHVKRLLSIAKSVAKDPRTKDLAIKALKYIGRGALTAAPMLLAA